MTMFAYQSMFAYQGMFAYLDWFQLWCCGTRCKPVLPLPALKVSSWGVGKCRKKIPVEIQVPTELLGFCLDLPAVGIGQFA